MKYISKSTLVLSGSHAAIDSNRKLFSASIIQLQSIVLFNKTYGWLSISIGMLLCVEQTICLKLGQLANTISCPPSNMEGFISKSDTESVVSVCMAEQKLEIVLSNFCLGLYQTSPVSCHNIYTSLSKLNHNSY